MESSAASAESAQPDQQQATAAEGFLEPSLADREGGASGRVQPVQWARRMAFLSDLVALTASLALVEAFSLLIGRPALDPVDLLLFVGLAPLWVVLANAFGAYRIPGRSVDWSLADDITPAFISASIWGWFWLIGRTAVHDDAIAVLPSLGIWAATILLVPTLRVGLRALLRSSPRYRQPVLVVGSRSGVDRVLSRIDRQSDWCLECAGSIAVERRLENGPTPEELAETASSLGASRVILAGWPEDLDDRTEILHEVLSAGVDVDVISGDPEAFRPTTFVAQMEGLPVVSLSAVTVNRPSRLLKRGIDFLIAGLGLVLLSPLIAYIAIRIKLDSPGPVFFRQARTGLGGSRFDFVKFRTMSADAEDRKEEVASLHLHAGDVTFKAARDPRVTDYGASLRRRSLDELPQLWNVLVGEMSLVGPRPLPVEEAELVPERYKVRQRVRPGLTGPWQVLGRSDIPFEDMVKLDCMYVSSWSPRGDLKLLLRTIGAILRPRGAY